MKIKDIGVKEVHCAGLSMNMIEIASMMKKYNVGMIPICDGKKLLGVLTDRDMVISCIAGNKDPKKCKAKDFMTSNPVTVSTDTNLEEAAKLMGKKQIRRLPVVEAGNIVGMVSLGDISMALSDKNDSLVSDTLHKISSPSTLKGSDIKQCIPTWGK